MKSVGMDIYLQIANAFVLDNSPILIYLNMTKN